MTNENRTLVVDQRSATHGRPKEDGPHYILGLDLDHRSLVRYSRNDQNFFRVLGHLETCAEKAQTVINNQLEGRQGTSRSIWST